MKQEDALINAANRISEIEPLEPSPLNFSLLKHGQEEFHLVRESLIEEFPFLWSGKDEFTEEECEKFQRLFSWLVKEIIEFSGDLSRPDERLAKALAIAAVLDHNDQLWSAIYSIFPVLPECVITALTTLFSGRHIDTYDILIRQYRSDKHARDIIADIERKKWYLVEWVIGRAWMEYYSPVKLQAAAALFRYKKPLLQSLLDAQTDLFEVVSYTHHAPIDKALQLALSSNNWTFKFWAFHKSIRDSDKTIFSSHWESLLFEASNDSVEWARWMNVLNQHPSRYPQIQEALGSVLARVSASALDIYLQTISMISSDMARGPVAAALTIFRQEAPIEKRRELWKLAFKKWEEWNFGRTDKLDALFNICNSVLDYAIVGYLVECLDATGRSKLVASLRLRAATLEAAWYPDISKAMTERFTIASIYQPLAIAELVSTTGTDWLVRDTVFTPPWEDGSLYRSLRYDTDFGRPTFLNHESFGNRCEKP